MMTTRRSVLAMAAAPAAEPLAGDDDWPPVAELVERTRAGMAALMRGDAAGYALHIPITADFLLMSPFGGPPSRGAEYTPARISRMAQFFRNGRYRLELIEAWATNDMVVIAGIERQNVEVGGMPAQDWPLRVTLVWRRIGSEWQLACRHADPLVAGISLEESARLARRTGG
jgi:ketosteroid isomerase-like protein